MPTPPDAADRFIAGNPALVAALDAPVVPDTPEERDAVAYANDVERMAQRRRERAFWERVFLAARDACWVARAVVLQTRGVRHGGGVMPKIREEQR